ncbi:TetR family transcriptional regulator [Rathayibacter iranicus]|uniref:TetR/AcrR family transcriptional regulator n=1 Tax=Rathayibacter iranicus TaxID=59737 RepID=A0AAD1EL49_9MICO|nr:TetR/AcrR family transcriptional regulator [Rathayibacter iranicus]AZZ54673.1 TetR/AcrR family transcriptional regulator [Rathayibacter iranicus]MWV30459.1 TetR family transcriptional regulator [Rathayibacter iranicus NCPPB 2253 = VKM Ac-1602]PPI51112.1 TetR family transcriptional regulator [Rathayibacter iranicus]PPI63452.1 TetR family transcriptional regulator [Rathayibacter iranicus]PPI74162.1 TetR family transcriptional regulator [Rathayibacter iranicus]
MVAVPPVTPARDRVLDGFEQLLIEQGERAATLDAVARKAGVSKGGLLYHFPSKDALVDGLLQRLDERREEDVARSLAAPEGVVAYLLRTSFAADSAFDRTILAVSRVAQGHDERASTALARIHDSWNKVVAEAVGDPLLARAIVLMSDGLYYNSALLPTGQESRGEAEDVLAVVQRLLAT